MKESRSRTQAFIISTQKLLSWWKTLISGGCGRDHWNKSQNSWMRVLALPLAGGFTLDKSLNLSETHILGKILTSTLSNVARVNDTEFMWKPLATAMFLYVPSSHCYGFFHNLLLSKQNAFSFFYSFLGRNLQLTCCLHSLFQKNAVHIGQRSTVQCQLPTWFGMCGGGGRNCQCVLDISQYLVGIY